MLSELGKFGASFILATQSLAKLNDLSRTMQDTILANVGCLAVFQVAGNDARQLVWELGKERVTEEDITSLDGASLLRPGHRGHRAAARLLHDGAVSRSMATPPWPSASAPLLTAYTLPARDLAGLMEGEADGQQKVSEYRRLLAERQNGAEPRGEGQV